MVFATIHTAPILTAPAHLVDRLLPWLNVVCVVILLTAALLHWQRTRHWSLLTMATGWLLMAVGVLLFEPLRYN